MQSFAQILMLVALGAAAWALAGLNLSKRLAAARGTSVSAMIQDYLDAEYEAEFGRPIGADIPRK